MDILVRDARDRLIELLQVGYTYPLRDLSVSTNIKVVFNKPALITIKNSQKDVLYQLHDQRQPVKRTDNKIIEIMGNGGDIELLTNPMIEDNTFEIFAIKPNKKSLSAYLTQSVVVRVGLDTALKASIVSGLPLNPMLDDGIRIVDYGVPINVKIDYTQEGVDYELVTDGSEESISVHKISGNSGSILLETVLMQEDTQIRVRATRKFSDTQVDSKLLDVTLSLKVRANPELTITPAPSAIIAYKTASALTIANTQASVSYQIFSRSIRDEDYVHDKDYIRDESIKVIPVKVAGEPFVQVKQAEFSDSISDFTSLGDPQNGNGGILTFTLPPLEDDTIVIVQASKNHAIGKDIKDGKDSKNTVMSNVWLTQPVPILVRPNAAPDLFITAYIKDGKTDGYLLVENGQPGVFYDFLTPPQTNPISLPAYFHKLGKGISQLALEVDFVIARDGSIENLIIETPRLPLGTVLNIRATKSQTRISTPLQLTAQIDKLPDIHLQDPIVNYNAETYILITASIQGEKYQPYLNDVIFKQARNGNGDELKFKTDLLTSDTTYDVYVTRLQDPHIPLLRIIPLTVLVRPNSRLVVSPSQVSIASGSTLQVKIEAAQSGVIYQLMQGTTPNGRPAQGQDIDLILTTEPLTTDTQLTVQATHSAYPDISVFLTQIISVTITAGN